MMFNRLSTFSATILVAFAAGVAGAPVAVAQSYPPPPGYSQPVQPTPYGLSDGYSDNRGGPDFDRLDDDDARGAGSTSLSPPGYQQPGPPQQAYQQQSLPPQGNVPLGPVMSPDDPRYGRPMAPPPVYSDRGPPQGYSDRGPAPIYLEERAPQGSNYGDLNRGLRPPGAVDGRSAAVPPQGGDDRPVVLSALPVDEQPETGPRQELEPRLRRQEVSFQTKEPAGTIIVDTPNTQLYYVLGGGRAIRYGVRVGRDGFTWTGVQKITRKAEWPDWHPPAEMIERQPYLPRFMAGGDGNPLGARAMYLGNTVYRIHGTNQPSTIGKFVSSGCIGMLNEDVTDLFDRVKVGTRVVVMPGGKPPDLTASAQPAPAGPLPMANAGSVGRAPVGVPNQGPTVVPPLPAPVTVR
jgi:lipoprotein-anchoring transpeptidase ErfK/SrfK